MTNQSPGRGARIGWTACFRARPVLASGWGDELGPAPAMPVLHAVLVEPGRTCSTAAVYASVRSAEPFPRCDPAADAPGTGERRGGGSLLSFARNDLEGPAQVCPEITDVLATARRKRDIAGTAVWIGRDLSRHLCRRL
jgi:4-diphosphocytidyl-2-C-methyl-D-erythritol kinase